MIVAVAIFLAPKTVTWMNSASSTNLKFMQELENSPEFACLRPLLLAALLLSNLPGFPQAMYLLSVNFSSRSQHPEKAFGETVDCRGLCQGHRQNFCGERGALLLQAPRSEHNNAENIFSHLRIRWQKSDFVPSQQFCPRVYHLTSNGREPCI